MSEQALIEALNDSLDRLAAGQTIEDCLRAHADVADDLRILLELGQATSRARADRSEVEGMRSRLDLHIDDLIDKTEFPKPSSKFPQGAAVILVASILLVIIGFVIFLPRKESQMADDVTNTATPSPEPTFTQISTVTLSETATASSTSIVTETETATSSATATASSTSSATATQTASPSLTATVTVSASPEATDCIVKPPDDWQIYQVQAGDALFTIAGQANTSVDALMQVNCLETHMIIEGQKLYIPVSNPTNTATMPSTSSNSSSVVPNISTQSSGNVSQPTKTVQATDEEYSEEEYSEEDDSEEDSSEEDESDSS